MNQSEKKNSKKRSKKTFTKKAIIIIISAGVFLGISAFSVHQYSMLNHKDQKIQTQQNEIGILASNLENQQTEKRVLVEKNQELKHTVQRLRDSVVMLQSEILELEQKVSSQRKTIKTIKSKLNKIVKEYATLKNKISEISRQDVVDKTEIEHLEEEKKHLRSALEKLNETQEAEVLAVSNTEKEIMQRRVEEARYLKLANIIRNTRVNFQKISLRKKDYSKSISKIKKKEKNWRYTIIEFFLENENNKILLDESFFLRIVDKDTDRAISYIEINPNFPNSSMDSKGIGFTYDGNMIELTFKNNQIKTGQNYEVQVFYKADDGREYLLSDGSKTFIENRKVIF